MKRPSSPSHTTADDDARVSRRPYRQPRIVWREAIEAMAADCTIPGGKNDATCILGFS